MIAQLIALVVLLITVVFGLIHLWISENVRSASITKDLKKGGGKGFVPVNYTLVSSERFIENLRKTKYEKILNDLLKSAKTCNYFSDIEHELEYHSTKEVLKTTLHNGQLKLFLTELQFLTETLERSTDAVYFIYAGSAPSNKIGFLSEMFPNVKFILVDPREHYVMYPNYKDMYDIKYREKFLYFALAKSADHTSSEIKVWKDSERVIVKRESAQNLSVPDDVADIIANGNETFYIIEDFYTNKISELLKPLCDKGTVLFISDIRSKLEGEGDPTDCDIIWNSALMYNWLEILKPTKFMLKFRTPYVVGPAAYKNIMIDYNANEFYHEAIESCKLPLIENIKNGKFSYITDDKIYVQSFAGQTSTESRIVASTLTIKDYDCNEYNNKFFYYNRIHRPYGYHTSHEKFLNPEIGIDRCGDCAVMCGIFKKYYEKFTDTVDDLMVNEVLGAIKKLLWVIRRDLKFGDTIHGRYFNPIKNIAMLIVEQNKLLGVNEALIVLNIKNIIIKEPLNFKDAYRYANAYNFFTKKYDTSQTEHIMSLIALGYYFGFKTDTFRNHTKFVCQNKNLDQNKILKEIYDFVIYLQLPSININNPVNVNKNEISIGDIKFNIGKCSPLKGKEPIAQFIETCFSINILNENLIISDSKFNKFIKACQISTGLDICSVQFSELINYENLKVSEVITFSSGRIFDFQSLKNKIVIIRMTKMKYEFRQLILMNYIKNRIKFIYIGRNVPKKVRKQEFEGVSHVYVSLKSKDLDCKDAIFNALIWINGIDESLIKIIS